MNRKRHIVKKDLSINNHSITSNYALKWGMKMEYKLEEVERDYIEFRKEMGEE